MTSKNDGKGKGERRRTVDEPQVSALTLLEVLTGTVQVTTTGRPPITYVHTYVRVTNTHSLE